MHTVLLAGVFDPSPHSADVMDAATEEPSWLSKTRRFDEVDQAPAFVRPRGPKYPDKNQRVQVPKYDGIIQQPLWV